MTVLLAILVAVLGVALVKAKTEVKELKVANNRLAIKANLRREAFNNLYERTVAAEDELSSVKKELEILNAKLEKAKARFKEVVEIARTMDNELVKYETEVKAMKEINEAYKPVNKELMTFLVEDIYFNDEILAEGIDSIGLELQSKYMGNKELNNLIIAKWEESANLLGVVQRKDARVAALEWKLDMEHAANEYWYGDTDTAELMG